MARKKKDAPAATDEQVQASGNIGSNSKERRAIVAEVVANTIRLKAQKAEIQAQITEERGRIKSLGIKAIDFNVALRLYELEVEDRNSSLDSIRECCEALGMGETVDWVKVVENEATGTEQRAPGYTAEEGRQAWRDNKRLKDNPYPEKSPSHALWEKGYMEVQAAAASQMGGNGESAAQH